MLPGLSAREAVTLLVLAGLVLALSWFIPMMLDMWRAYRQRDNVLGLLRDGVIKAAGQDGLTIDELRAILATLGRPASGQQGLNRGLMALTLITVTSVGVFALLVSNSQEAADLRKTAFASLFSILATIVGFYFGTRAATPSDGTAPEPKQSGGSGQGAGGAPEVPPAPVIPVGPPSMPGGPAAPAVPGGPAVPGSPAVPVSPAGPAVPFDRLGDFDAAPEPQVEPERAPLDVAKELPDGGSP